MQGYVPIAFYIVAAFLAAVAFVVISHLLGPRKPSPVKGSVYECGKQPFGPARGRFSVKFYVVAVAFVLFDIEAAFIFPWALVYRALGVVGVIEMAIFIAILFIGLLYILKKGVLSWG
jgi:NADH-quinone oxidoreductase subunit A